MREGKNRSQRKNRRNRSEFSMSQKLMSEGLHSKPLLGLLLDPLLCLQRAEQCSTEETGKYT